MATKAALVNGEERPGAGKLTPSKRQGPNAEPNMLDKAVGAWKEFTHFLGDVRGEMRKVVTPSRKEVEATTTVVIVAVFIFGLFFFVVDSVFSYGLDRLLKQLGGLSQ
jgi:preprotein translocase subunit SecE